MGSTDYSYSDVSNELESYTANQKLKVDLEYDLNGSLLSEDFVRQGKAYKSTDYVWDRENRLASVVYSDASRPSFLPSLEENRLDFSYDDFGNRIKKSANGSDTWYVNNGLSVLNEIDSEGAVSNSIVQGLGLIAEIDASGEVKFIHQDVLDSTVLISDASGQVVQQYEYDVFGSVIGADGDSGSRYLFTNQEYDSESDLYYYNARYYNPKLGRFISRDTFMGRAGDSVSKNRYIYVKNNPLKYTDPTGNEEEGVKNTQVMQACGETKVCLAMGGGMSDLGTVLGSKINQFISDSSSNVDVTEHFLNIMIDAGVRMNAYWNPVDKGLSPWNVPDDLLMYFIKQRFDNVANSDLEKLKYDNPKVWAELQKTPFKFQNFYDYVKPGGKWDLKANYPNFNSGWVSMSDLSNAGTNAHTFYFTEPYGYKGLGDVKIGDHTYANDVPGNVLYGYAGVAAGFSEETLKMMAGLGQKQVGTSKPEWGWDYSYYDDPDDQKAIEQGIKLWNSYDKGINIDSLNKFMSPLKEE